MKGRYAHPEAFAQALKERIKRRASQNNMGFNRVLQIVLFERFLERVYAALGDAVILKGGLAMELRLQRARTTKDIDMRVEGDLDQMIATLRQEAARQKQDYLAFSFVGEEDFQEMIGRQVVYGGRRLRIQAQLADRPFGSIFKLDLSVADKLVLPPDVMEGTSLLDFIGIEPVRHRVYPIEAHLAEKLHAMTMVFDGAPSGRVKDLVDTGLLAKHKRLKAATLWGSINATFDFRRTHQIPPYLSDPPEFWENLYDHIRKEDQLPWDTLSELHALCSQFLNPLLAETVSGEAYWSPDDEWWDEP